MVREMQSTVDTTDGNQPGKSHATKSGAENEQLVWSDVRAELAGLPNGGFNIAHEAVDRHVSNGRGAHVAIRWLAKSGEITDITYATLKEQSDSFASALQALGLGKGVRFLSCRTAFPNCTLRP